MGYRWNVDRIMRWVQIAIIITLLILVLNYLSGVLLPFCLAFIVAYIVDPLVNYLQKKMRYRILAVLTVFLGAFLLIGGALYLFIPRIVQEVRLLGTLISKIFYDAEWSSKIMEFIPKDLWSVAQNFISWDKIADAMQTMDFWNALHSVGSKLISGSIGMLSGTAMVVFWFASLTLVLLYLIFIMLDMPRLRQGAWRLVPKKWKASASSLAKDMDVAMGSYFRAQAWVAFLVGVLFSTAFTIVGFPLGLMFGIFIGCLNMIPYMQILSIPIALLLGIVYSLDAGIPFWEVALMVTGIYVGIQLLQDLVLVPNIVGKSMNLPPIGILLSLSIWGKLLGFLGLIVAIPFTCLCLIYLQKISNKIEDHSNEELALEGSSIPINSEKSEKKV
ncbi:MAG: AI-2E family transporter [Fibrobacteraceae bacterium]|nr:AI-2E family transporter [Fibrobacteraceae bacterium]